MRMLASREVPSAEGVLEYGPTDNNNTRVRIHLKHMAPPQRVNPDATTYVAWAEPTKGKGRIVNLGAIKIDDDLNGGLDTQTPLRSFNLYITAEQSPTAVEPTGAKLMTARIERVD